VIAAQRAMTKRSLVVSARACDGLGRGGSERKLGGGTLYLGGISKKECSDAGEGASEIEIFRWEGVTAVASPDSVISPAGTLEVVAIVGPSGTGRVESCSGVAAARSGPGVVETPPSVIGAMPGDIGVAFAALSLSGQGAGTTGVSRLSKEATSSGANRSVASAGGGPDTCRPSSSGRAGVPGDSDERWRSSDAAWPARSEGLPIVF